MSNTGRQIDEAKTKADNLKAQIKKARQQKGISDDMDVMKELAAQQASIPRTVKEITCNRTLKGHFGKIYSLHWAGDSSRIVTASQDGKLIIWNAFTTNKVGAIPLRSSWVMTCAFEQSKGKMVACGGLDNLCSIYHLGDSSSGHPTTSRAAHELTSHDGYLSCCRFIDEGRIVTSSGDSTCILWDIERLEPIAHYTDHGGDAMSVSVNPQANHLFVSGSCDSTAKVWDTRALKCTHTFHGHESDINSVAFMPNGHSFVSGSDDSSAIIFDLRAYSQLGKFGSDKIVCGITAVAVSNSGRLVFAGYDDYKCYGWDCLAVNERPSFELQDHDNRVSCLGVNSKGQALCTGSWDNLLKVWA